MASSTCKAVGTAHTPAAARAKATAEQVVADRLGRRWVLSNQGRVHQLMAAHSLKKIETLYGSIFEGILGEIFDIQWQGQPLQYEGPMVKRAAPGGEDWLLLEAGDVLSATVDISEAWNLARPGDYQLQLRNGISYRVEGETEPRQLDPAACGVVHFAVAVSSE